MNLFIVSSFPVILFASGILNSKEKQIITRLFQTK
jgi:hypothetical protein